MRRIFAILSSYWVVTLLLLAVACGLLWLGGTRWNWNVDARLTGMALFALVWLVAAFIRQLSRSRAQQKLEKLLDAPTVPAEAGVDPDGYAEFNLMRDRLLKAVATLKASRGTGGGGANALAVLPWYLVLGQPAAGKTSLLRNSGLHYPLSEAGAVQGIGGTRNCDWYFSTDAVLLDTAGRYVTEERSNAELLNFLRLLKKYRGKPPVNGMILVVSLPELLQASAQEAAVLARQLADRVQEGRRALGVNPPLYLMFSKSDLLPGFSEFFASLDSEARKTPWGFTLPLDGAFDSRAMDEKFATRLDELAGRLSAFGRDRLPQTPQDEQLGVYGFPFYFGKTRVDVRAFVRQLVASNDASGRDTPPIIVRGAYFTSALQEGPALGAVIEQDVQETFGLHAGAAQASLQSGANAAARKSFFIQDVFTQIVFPDQNLARYYTGTGRYKPWRPAAIGLMAAAGVAVCAALGWSYKANRDTIQAVRQDIGTVVATRQAGQAQGDARAMARKVQSLENTYGRIARFALYRREGAPLAQRFGLYQGDALDQLERKAYFAQLNDLVIAPAGRRIAGQLAQMSDSDFKRASVRRTGAHSHGGVQGTDAGATDADGAARPEGIQLSGDVAGRLDQDQVAQINHDYLLLKLYLMMSRKAHVDPDFVRRYLPPEAAAALDGQDADTALPINALRRHIALYADNLALPEVPAQPRSDDTVAQARKVLNAYVAEASPVEHIYVKLRVEIGKQYPSVTLAKLLDRQSTAPLGARFSLPAFYTRDVWEKAVRPAMYKAAATNRQDADWVLHGSEASSATPQQAFVSAFMARYTDDYAREWKRFLSGLWVQRFNDLKQGSAVLRGLADPQTSPYKALVASVDRNLVLDTGLGTVTRPAERGLLDRAKSLLGSRGVPDAVASEATQQAAQAAQHAAQPGLTPLQQDFLPILDLRKPNPLDGAGSASMLDKYLQYLQRVRARIDYIAASSDPGRDSRKFMQETSNGHSELFDALNYVSASMNLTNKDFKSLDTAFSVPLGDTWNALRQPAAQDVSKQWDAGVAEPWKKLTANRYPFTASAGNDASVKDVMKFVAPDNGVIASFAKTQLDGIATVDDGQVKAQQWAGLGQAVELNPRFVDVVDTSRSVGQVMTSVADPGNGFELYVEPSPQFTDVSVDIDGQHFRYRNGPESWNRFVWPKDGATAGVRVEAVTLDGTHRVVANFPGRWGLLKMIESASVSNVDGVRQRLTWNTPEGPVNLLVRNYSGEKITDLTKLRDLSMPSSVAN